MDALPARRSLSIIRLAAKLSSRRPALSSNVKPHQFRLDQHDERLLMYVPPGFNTVTPYYFVSDAEAFVSFLLAGFGGREVCRTMRQDGKIQNVQVQLGTSTVMVSEATSRYPAMASAFYLYVANADQSMKRAIEHGATLEMPVGDMPYGDRQGGVRDRHGNIWWISERTVHEPYQP